MGSNYPADHPLAADFEEQMIALIPEYRGDGESVHHPDEPDARDHAPDATALALLGPWMEGSDKSYLHDASAIHHEAAGMKDSSGDKPYRFWAPFIVDLFKFAVNIAIAIGLFWVGRELMNEEARPLVKHIGKLRQFADEENIRTVRLKNFSTRQDAVLTSLEFIVTDIDFLERIRLRDPFLKNAPPIPRRELILSGSEVIALSHGEWSRDGTSYRFSEDIDLRIGPGESESLRLAIASPESRAGLWDEAWFEGKLIVSYDDDTVVIPRVVLVNKSTEPDPNIPPKW